MSVNQKVRPGGVNIQPSISTHASSYSPLKGAIVPPQNGNPMQNFPVTSSTVSNGSDANFLFHQALDTVLPGGTYIDGLAFGVPGVSYDPSQPQSHVNGMAHPMQTSVAMQPKSDQDYSNAFLNHAYVSVANGVYPQVNYLTGGANLLNQALNSLNANPYANAFNHQANAFRPQALALPSPSVGPSYGILAGSLMSPMITNPLLNGVVLPLEANVSRAVGAANAAFAGLPLQLQLDRSCDGKIFIGGLSQATNNDTLRSYFTKIGPVKEGFVKLDPITQRSRGFGFVTFHDPNDSQKAIDNGPHELDGKYLDVKQALPHNLTQDPSYTAATKKVYVGGLPQSVDTPALGQYFSQYGPLEHAMVMHDQSGISRGFGYVTFKAQAHANAVVDRRFHFIHETRVECKMSQPKNTLEKRKSNNSPGMANNGQLGLLGPPPAQIQPPIMVPANGAY